MKDARYYSRTTLVVVVVVVASRWLSSGTQDQSSARLESEFRFFLTEFASPRLVAPLSLAPPPLLLLIMVPTPIPYPLASQLTLTSSF
jgi:hypothetical protein